MASTLSTWQTSSRGRPRSMRWHRSSRTNVRRSRHMPDPAYRVARQVARQLVAELQLAPPFDVERVAGRFAEVLDEDIPTHADVIVLHAQRPGDLPRIV